MGLDEYTSGITGINGIMIPGNPALAAGQSEKTAEVGVIFPEAGINFVKTCVDTEGPEFPDYAGATPTWPGYSIPKGTPSLSFNVIKESNESNNCSDWVQVDVVAAPAPDLISNISDTIPRLVTKGSKYNLSAFVQNQGNVSTNYKGVETFTNLIQVATFTKDGVNHSPADLKYIPTTVDDYPIKTSGPLDVIGSFGNKLILNKSVTFDTNGQYFYRACADKKSKLDINGDIVESNSSGTGESNNCSDWVQINVSDALQPSGILTVTPSSCIIAKDESICTVTGAKWNTTNAVSPALIDGNTGTTLSALANNDVTPLKVWVAYPQTVFNLQDGITPLDSKIVTATCVAGTGWDGFKCIADLCPYDAGIQTTLPCINQGPVGSLDGLDCEIKLNKNTCTTTLTLNIVSPVSGAETNITKAGDIEVAKNLLPASKSNIVVDYPNTTFFLNHNMATVASKLINATCELGTEWSVNQCIKSVVPVPDVDGIWGDWNKCSCDATGENGTQSRSCIGRSGNGLDCQPNSDGGSSRTCSCGGPELNMTLTATPGTIYKGKISTLNWTSTVASCKVTDNNGVTLISDTGNNKEGTIQVKPIKTTTYTLTCKGGAAGETKDASVKVINVVIIEG